MFYLMLFKILEQQSIKKFLFKNLEQKNYNYLVFLKTNN